VQRIYVHQSIQAAFVRELVAHVEALQVGDPMSEDTDVSALIDRGETERVEKWIQEAVDAGASVATGGRVEDGVLVPTVLTGVTPDMEVCRTEVFGPVVGVAAYDDYDEALRLANDTRYGLQAGVFTADLGKALQAGRTLDFGGVTVNEVPTWRADQMPYGGVRDSGNTREGPPYAVHEMTERRLVVLQP
jgi:acyl-CoA reductase-like NAD-dependent aldehyde dehydrogenase